MSPHNSPTSLNRSAASLPSMAATDETLVEQRDREPKRRSLGAASASYEAPLTSRSKRPRPLSAVVSRGWTVLRDHLREARAAQLTRSARQLQDTGKSEEAIAALVESLSLTPKDTVRKRKLADALRTDFQTKRQVDAIERAIVLYRQLGLEGLDDMVECIILREKSRQTAGDKVNLAELDQTAFTLQETLEWTEDVELRADRTASLARIRHVIGDLDGAIEFSRESVSVRPTSTPRSRTRWFQRACQLGLLLRYRGSDSDLSELISLLLDVSETLGGLCSDEIKIFRSQYVPSPLKDVIGWQQETVVHVEDCCSGTDFNYHLARAFRAHFNALKRFSDLEKAISHFTLAVSHSKASPFVIAAAPSLLAECLRRRYELLHRAADIHRAIVLDSNPMLVELRDAHKAGAERQHYTQGDLQVWRCQMCSETLVKWSIEPLEYDLRAIPSTGS